MPKIYFEGREYESTEGMTPEARARYEKAVQMLPDRDNNGIPDLLESDGITPVTPPPAGPAASTTVPEVIAAPAQTRRIAQASSRKTRWILLAVVGLIITCGVCLAVFIFGVISLLRSSGAYQLALETAKTHPTVQQVLGIPIQEGLFATGSVSENGSSGFAELEIPLDGPNRSGTLHVEAVREEKTWRLTSLVLEAGGQEYQLVP